MKRLRHGEIVDANSEVIDLNPYAFVVIKESSPKTNVESKRDDVQGLFRTILTLQDVSVEDAGMYICIVDDHQDRSLFKYTYLHVQEGVVCDFTKNSMLNLDFTNFFPFQLHSEVKIRLIRKLNRIPTTWY